jgi:glycosyltransferase involved in cell wall biosynthesis
VKAAISTGPGQHAQHLIGQLVERGLVQRVIYHWPEFEVWDVDGGGQLRRRVRLEWYSQLARTIWRVWRRVPHLGRYESPNSFLYLVYDLLASRYLGTCDALIGWSQMSLHCLRRARHRGAVAILEHPIAHVCTSVSLVRDEYRQFGAGAPLYLSLYPRGVIRRMLAEYQVADSINVASTFAKRTFDGQGVPNEKVMVTLLSSVDGRLFVPGGVRQGGPFTILYVGRMELRKGVHYLLQAFEELSVAGAELWLVGPLLPEMEPFLKRAKKGVKYLGTLPRNELPKIYQAASVFVLPSIEDGFGLVIVEAMACGLPVIATENTGGPDIIRDGVDGFLVPIRDAQALRARLSWLYEHRDECRDMGQRAHERTVADFNLSRYGERLVDNLSKAMDRGRS